MQAPAQYVPPFDAALGAAEREKLYFRHALPLLWWEMPYDRFLAERRARMAQVIQHAWRELIGDGPEPEPRGWTVPELIASGEGGEVEFKSTLRKNLHTGQHDDRIQMTALRAVAGFLNAGGGTLLIGVQDNGEVLGIGADEFQNEDKMALHLVNLVRDRIGDVFLPYVHPHFEDHDGRRVLTVRCERGPKPAYVKDGAQARFFVRGGNATAELVGQSVVDYIASRFPMRGAL